MRLQQPYVPDIREECSLKKSVDWEPVLKLELKLHITDLPEILAHRIIEIGPGAQRPHFPAPHVVGAAGDKCFFIGQGVGVAVRDPDTSVKSRNQLVLLAYRDKITYIEVRPDIFGIRDAEKGILAVFVLCRLEEAGYSVKQVAAGLKIGPDVPEGDGFADDPGCCS